MILNQNIILNSKSLLNKVVFHYYNYMKGCSPCRKHPLGEQRKNTIYAPSPYCDLEGQANSRTKFFVYLSPKLKHLNLILNKINKPICGKQVWKKGKRPKSSLIMRNKLKLWKE